MNADTGVRVAERLYYDSQELTFRAQVTDIQLVAQEQGETRERAQLWRVALDRTAFYPESGGQPWDTGVLLATARSGAVLEVAVERVEEDEAGEVWHFVRKPLVEGTLVEGRVDAIRRIDHMQQHSGQHLLSAVFLDQLAAKTVSFHLGAEVSTIDLVLAEGVKALERVDLNAVEDRANQLIFENRDLVSHWHSRAEAESMLASGLLRKLPERQGPLRIVQMQGVEFNACGGTHVSSTAAIGGLFLRRVEKVKQGWRVEFVCGLRAVEVARREYQLLSSLAVSMSVGPSDLPLRLSALQDEVKQGAKVNRALLEELAEAKATELMGATREQELLQTVFPGKPMEFAKRVASIVAAAGHRSVMGVTEPKAGALVVALPANDPHHAGNLLREVCAEKGARGGGGPQLAQAVCGTDVVVPLAAAVVQRLREA